MQHLEISDIAEDFITARQKISHYFLTYHPREAFTLPDEILTQIVKEAKKYEQRLESPKCRVRVEGLKNIVCDFIGKTVKLFINGINKNHETQKSG